MKKRVLGGLHLAAMATKFEQAVAAADAPAASPVFGVLVDMPALPESPLSVMQPPWCSGRNDYPDETAKPSSHRNRRW